MLVAPKLVPRGVALGLVGGLGASTLAPRKMLPGGLCYRAGHCHNSIMPPVLGGNGKVVPTYGLGAIKTLNPGFRV